MSSSAQKKKLDEKNAKILRELANLPENRHCFECGTRGVTYVNITECSFCCTTCSGILRGLNPPHRVKSISMATFTAEEIEHIRAKGNAVNATIWLALYGGTPPVMSKKDDIAAFLVKKYEKKTWYVSPAEFEEQKRLMETMKETVSTARSDTKSVGSSSSKVPDLDLLSNDPFAMIASAKSQPNHEAFSPPAFSAPPPPSMSSASSSGTSAVSGASNAFFPSSVSFPNDANAFADFDRHFAELSMNRTTTAPSAAAAFPSSMSQPFPTASRPVPMVPVRPQPQPIPMQAVPPNVRSQQMPLAVAPSIPTTAPISTAHPMATVNHPMATVPPMPNVLPMATVPPMSTVPPMPTVLHSMPAVDVFAPQPTSQPVQMQNQSAGDKYSALAELDQLFHGTSSNDGKQSWMPTGFSTGPAAHAYVPAFPEGNAKKPPQQQPMQGFGNVPRSSTMGAIAEQQMPQAKNMHSNSQFELSNPFLNPQPPIYNNGFAPPQQMPVAGPNPFGQPTMNFMYGANTVDAHLGAPKSQVAGGGNNWNPFL